MALEFGPKLGFVVHADESENWYDELTRFLRAYDALVQCTAIAATVASPPGSPADGDVYLLPTGASGAWSGHSGHVARWSSKISAWEFYVPAQGWFAWCDESTGYMKSNGSQWVTFDTPIIPIGPTFAVAYADATLSNANKTTSTPSVPATGSPTIGFPRSTGKVYVEFSSTASIGGPSIAIGLVGNDALGAIADGSAWGGYWFPGGASVLLWTANGFLREQGGSGVAVSSFDDTNIFGFAVDFDLGLAWLIVDGAAASGDPVAGTGGYDITVYGANLRPFVGLGEDEYNMTIHASAADQTFSPPTGFEPWYP